MTTFVPMRMLSLLPLLLCCLPGPSRAAGMPAAPPALFTVPPHEFDDTVRSAATPQDTLRASGIVGLRQSAAGDSAPRERIAAVDGIADIVRTFSGVQLKDYGGLGGLKTINVRSLGSEHTGIFIDGIQVDNAQNMQVDLGRFSPEHLGTVTLYHGQRSRWLQAAKEYSLANALYLESLPPADARRTLRLRLRGGSFGSFAPSATFEGNLGRGNSFRAGGEYVRTDGRYRFTADDTTMLRQNTDLASFRAEAAFFHRGAARWDAKIYFYDSERGLPGPVVRRPQQDVLSMDRQADRDFFVQGNWQQGQNLLKAKYSRTWTRYTTDPWKEPSALPVDNRYARQSAYLSASHLFTLGFLRLNAAQDLQYNRMEANLTGFVRPRRLSSWTALAAHAALRKLNLSASLVDQAVYDGFAGGAAGGFARENRFRNFLSPALVWEYVPAADRGTREVRLSGFAKRSCRMPSFNDLYYTLVGNCDLRPEQAWQIGLTGAYRRAFSRGWTLSAGAEGYWNAVTDKIVAVPTASQFRWSMYNIGRARIAGVDLKGGLSVRRRLAAELMLRYSYQCAADLTRPGAPSYRGQIPYIPRHSGSVNASLTFRGWRADLCWLLTGRRWSNSANLPEFGIRPWQTVDLWLSRSLGDITLRLSLHNLLNEQYEVVKGYPMPGFHLLGTLEYSFGIRPARTGGIPRK